MMMMMMTILFDNLQQRHPGVYKFSKNLGTHKDFWRQTVT
jgi:hypothetical protein